MPLRCPRFARDPILERCAAGEHRMLAPEDGVAVLRVQDALARLGYAVGDLDGKFGSDTGNAVSAYKTAKGLSPTDPVVGPGTSKALDDDFFFDPPELDPAFAEFAAAVASGHVEPFVALEIAGFLSAPFGSWRRMLARSTREMLNAQLLTGIVVQTRDQTTTRAGDLRQSFLDVAAPTQVGGTSAERFFEDQTRLPPAPFSPQLGETVPFMRNDGTPCAFVLIRDDVALGRAVTLHARTGRTVRESTRSVTLHEISHARNVGVSEFQRSTADSDTETYFDTALAATASTGSLITWPAGIAPRPLPTANVFESFVAEICARHVEWIVEREAADDPFAPARLQPAELGSAALFYFHELPGVFSDNGYMAEIIRRGDAAVFPQLQLWLNRCAEFLFSDDQGEDARTSQLFRDAGQWCLDLLTADPIEFPEMDGLRPLERDFT